MSSPPGLRNESSSAGDRRRRNEKRFRRLAIATNESGPHISWRLAAAACGNAGGIGPRPHPVLALRTPLHLPRFHKPDERSTTIFLVQAVGCMLCRVRQLAACTQACTRRALPALRDARLTVRMPHRPPPPLAAACSLRTAPPGASRTAGRRSGILTASCVTTGERGRVRRSRGIRARLAHEAVRLRARRAAELSVLGAPLEDVRASRRRAAREAVVAVRVDEALEAEVVVLLHQRLARNGAEQRDRAHFIVSRGGCGWMARAEAMIRERRKPARGERPAASDEGLQKGRDAAGGGGR